MASSVGRVTAVFWILTNWYNLKRGERALSGKEEYLPSHLFSKTDEEVWVIGRGSLITVYDPDAPEGTPPVWEWNNETEYGKYCVPKGYRIRVLHGWVRMSTSGQD
jgi:hypothetical protein